MKTKKVVSCFLRHNKRILLMKRSSGVGSYPLYWGVVAGYVEDYDRNVLERAVTEIEEETGFGEDDIKLVKVSKPFFLEDKSLDVRFHIHPFLFEARRDDVKIDWEHTEFRWIDLKDFGSYKVVPNLKESLRRVR